MTVMVMTIGLRPRCVCLALVGLGACATQRSAPPVTAATEVAAEAVPAKPAEGALDSAVAELRHVIPAKLSEAEQEKKSAALDAAWKQLQADPAHAVPALKAEYERFTARGERDDYYTIEAAYLIFKMRGPAELATLERMYAGLDVSANFRVVFETRFLVASSGEPRALPFLRKAFDLPPAAARVTFARHALTIGWPQILEFMLAPLGPAVCPLAEEVASSASEPGPLVGALDLLQANLCAGTPEILRRRLAAASDENVVGAMLRGLGTWAAPADRLLLERHLADKRPVVRASAAFALYELGDPASNPALRRMLADGDDQTRAEVIGSLFHTLDRDNARAIVKHRKDAKCPEGDREIIGKLVERLAELTGVDQAPLLGGDERKWKQAIATYWSKRDRRFALGPGERTLTRGELQAALAEWSESASITGGKWAWVESPQVLAVATAEDIPGLLAVRARLFFRQSDEMLYEVAIIDRLLEVLHRRQIGAARPLISRFGTFD